MMQWRRVFSDVSTSSQHSLSVVAAGTSTPVCFPFFIAVIAIGTCQSHGVAQRRDLHAVDSEKLVDHTGTSRADADYPYANYRARFELHSDHAAIGRRADKLFSDRCGCTQFR